MISQKEMRAPMVQPHQVLLPEGWPRPKGYTNGIVAKGAIVFLSGQVGWDANGTFAEGIVAQIRQTLQNIVHLLAEAGTGPESLVRLTWFVTDIDAYANQLKEIGAVYRDVLTHNYPPMSLVQVTRLVEDKALVEIEATAVIQE